MAHAQFVPLPVFTPDVAPPHVFECINRMASLGIAPSYLRKEMKSTTMHTRFAHIWNEIVDAMREEDILSERERRQLRYFLIQLRLPTVNPNARNANFAPEAQVCRSMGISGLGQHPPNSVPPLHDLVCLQVFAGGFWSVFCLFLDQIWQARHSVKCDKT